MVVTTCSILLGAMMGGAPDSSSMYIELIANAIVAVLICCLIICAFVMTSFRRAFAIGFVVPACLYGFTLTQAGTDDFDLNNKPKHSISRYLRALYAKISRDAVIDMETQQEIEDYPSLTLQERSERPALFVKMPVPANFLYFAQLLILMFVGYCGGNFARWAYWIDSNPRRTME